MGNPRTKSSKPRSMVERSERHSPVRLSEDVPFSTGLGAGDPQTSRHRRLGWTNQIAGPQIRTEPGKDKGLDAFKGATGGDGMNGKPGPTLKLIPPYPPQTRNMGGSGRDQISTLCGEQNKLLIGSMNV